MMTEHDKAHIEELICGDGTWFTAKLCRLIAKADEGNRAKLYKGFPEEVDAVCMYLDGKPFENTIGFPTGSVDFGTSME